MAICIKPETARTIQDQADAAKLDVQDFLVNKGYAPAEAGRIKQMVDNTLSQPLQQKITAAKQNDPVLRDSPRNRSRLRANIRGIMEADGLLTTKRVTTGGKKWGDISQAEINRFLQDKGLDLDKATQREVRKLMKDEGLIQGKEYVHSYQGAEAVIKDAIGKDVTGDVDVFMRSLTVDELKAVRMRLLTSRRTPGDVVLVQKKGMPAKTNYHLDLLARTAASKLAVISKFRGAKGAFEQMHWLFERMERTVPGITNIFLRPVTKAQKALNIESAQRAHEIKAFFKENNIGLEGRKRIAIDGYWDQPEARAGLESMGITERPKLTPEELQVKQYLRENVYEPMYARLNQARAARGLEPLDYVDNYMTFFRDLEAAAEAGFDVHSMSKASFESKTAQLRQVGLRHAIKRVKESDLPLKLDALGNAQTYVHNSLRFVHLSPVIAELRSHMSQKYNLGEIAKKHGGEVIPNELVGRKDFQFMRDAYPLARQLNNWLDHVINVKQEHAFSWLDPYANWANRSLAVGYLSANLRFFLIQPTVLARVWHQIGFLGGPKYLLSGAIDALRDFYNASPDLRRGPGKYQRGARAESNVLATRTFDAFVDNTATKLAGKGKLSAAKYVYDRIGDAGIHPGQLIDEISANISYYAAKRYGAKKLKLQGEELINYADDVVLFTNGSGSRIHRAPIQRTPTGQMATLFQTFLINDFYNMVRQTTRGRHGQRILGKTGTREVIKSMVAFATITAIVNSVYEAIGMQAPFAAPISAFIDEVNEEGEVTMGAFARALTELGEAVPVIGGAVRYGGSLGGAALDLADTMIAKAKGDQRTPPWWVLLGRISRFPLTAPLYQASRALKDNEQGNVRGVRRGGAAPRGVPSR